MITLRTGVPGSGKSLSAVEALANLIARWEKNPDEARPVFVHGVKDLAIPHAVLPLHEIMIGKTKSMVPDWSVVPDGAFVLIDEAQTIFPPRASGSAVPPHVEFLNTHRHRGFDIEVITQHPKLIDTSLRALVGKHQHYRRLFGGQRAMVYEWDSCSDNLGGMANAVTSYYSYPKKAFQFYKSAEVHTKQSFRYPKWILLPIVGIIGGAFAFPMAYGRITQMGNTEKARAAITSVGKPAQPASAPTVAASSPTPSSVPIAPVVPAVPPEPAYAGCVVSAGRCGCFDSKGIKITVEAQVCHDVSGANSPPPAEFPDSPRPHLPFDPDEREALRFAFSQKR